MNPPPLDAATFRSVMGAVPTAVTVLTIVDAHGVDRGMTVGAFSSVSLEPPLILACIGNDATIAAPMRDVTHFGVSVLAEGQEALSRLFADTEARTFAGVPHHRGAHGLPLLDGAAAHLECRITARHPAGDHAIVVAEVLAAMATQHPPLVHHRGAYTRLAR